MCKNARATRTISPVAAGPGGVAATVQLSIFPSVRRATPSARRPAWSAWARWRCWTWPATCSRACTRSRASQARPGAPRAAGGARWRGWGGSRACSDRARGVVGTTPAPVQACMGTLARRPAQALRAPPWPLPRCAKGPMLSSQRFSSSQVFMRLGWQLPACVLCLSWPLTLLWRPLTSTGPKHRNALRVFIYTQSTHSDEMRSWSHDACSREACPWSTNTRDKLCSQSPALGGRAGRAAAAVAGGQPGGVRAAVPHRRARLLPGAGRPRARRPPRLARRAGRRAAARAGARCASAVAPGTTWPCRVRLLDCPALLSACESARDGVL